MKANPGGVLSGDAIIGREHEMKEIVDILEVQSVLLTSERRVGKTTLLRKLTEISPKGWTILNCTLEGKSHPIECVKAIYTEAVKLRAQSGISRWRKLFTKSYDWLSNAKIYDSNLPRIKRDWKNELGRLIKDIVENIDKKVVICLDEYPRMVWKIAREIHEDESVRTQLAIEFLDVFRELRQKYEDARKIRFILCGSIGLHLVIKYLENEKNYTGAPTNDMRSISLGGMKKEDVEKLCHRLLTEEKIEMANYEFFIMKMIEYTDALPNFIQLVCEQFQKRNYKQVDPQDIEKTIKYLLNEDSSYNWFDLARDRINKYYGNRKELSRDILKYLSHHTNFTPEKEIIDYLKSKTAIQSEHVVIDTLNDLRKDHYLIREIDAGRKYRFKYNLLRLWWERNLG